MVCAANHGSDKLEFVYVLKDELNKVYDDENLPEKDNYTPGVLEDTYLNMELAIPRDGSGTEPAKVTK